MMRSGMTRADIVRALRDRYGISRELARLAVCDALDLRRTL
jgi:hypothetical protein